MAVKSGEYIEKAKILEDELTDVLKNFGNMKDDEERAREQLDEIQELLKESKSLIRSYKLPIIADNYFVELSEANDSILEIIKELENKPISIATLNTRVDTSRDLVLKLYNTTNKIVKTAKLAEYLVVYGNRYRNDNIVDKGLSEAEFTFNRGNYEKSLSIALNTIERVDSTIKERVRVYEENN
jgi:septation ring formation regulator